VERIVSGATLGVTFGFGCSQSTLRHSTLFCYGIIGGGLVGDSHDPLQQCTVDKMQSVRSIE
jgi:hypothetical protein